MDGHLLLVWVHILLFVFWLGADVGVFSAAYWVKRRGQSFNERMLLLKVAGFVDLAPRLCMAWMLPVGLLLARTWGLETSDLVLNSLWCLAVIWSLSIIVAYNNEGKPIAATIAKIQMTAFAIGALIAFWYGGTLFGDPTVPHWLAVKMVLFGVIFLLAIGIDLTFRPVIGNMLRLAAEGNTDSVETALNQSINRCLVVVSSLYIVLLIASFMGVMKI